jgi:hypothetical protein
MRQGLPYFLIIAQKKDKDYESQPDAKDFECSIGPLDIIRSYES